MMARMQTLSSGAGTTKMQEATSRNGWVCQKEKAQLTKSLVILLMIPIKTPSLEIMNFQDKSQIMTFTLRMKMPELMSVGHPFVLATNLKTQLDIPRRQTLNSLHNSPHSAAQA